MLILNKEKRRWEHRCDDCSRLLGTEATGILDAGAGYVLGVGKRQDGVLCGGGRGCRSPYIHPLACSDACEDRLLTSWPRMDAANVYVEDWLPDFRDADVAEKTEAPREGA